MLNESSTSLRHASPLFSFHPLSSPSSLLFHTIFFISLIIRVLEPMSNNFFHNTEFTNALRKSMNVVGNFPLYLLLPVLSWCSVQTGLIQTRIICLRFGTRSTNSERILLSLHEFVILQFVNSDVYICLQNCKYQSNTSAALRVQLVAILL